ncbi:MAG: FAD-binding oxidoreductase, partial [Candidatus Thioglobus sp.]
MSPDVVIVGAGITGCASAYALSKLGLRVEVIEKYFPASMGSGWTLGGVRQSGRDPAELPLAQFSVKKWLTLNEELEAETGYLQHGNLRLARTEKEKDSITALVASQKALGLDLSLLSRSED